MNQSPHYLADVFKFSLDATKNRNFPFNGFWQNFLIIVAGGVAAYAWHVAALAICAWGVFGAVANAHADVVRRIIAINDSLIAMDNERASEFDQLSSELRRFMTRN